MAVVIVESFYNSRLNEGRVGISDIYGKSFYYEGYKIILYIYK